MPRRPTIRSSDCYYHIVTRCNHKHWFSIPLNQVWEICKTAFIKAHDEHPAELYQFVLMGNHYHMVLRTPNADVDRYMYFFNKTLSEKIRIGTGEINRMFGGRYKASLITHQNHLLNVYRYVYQNPLKANTVKKCESYKFSTLRYEINNSKFSIPIHSLFDIDADILKTCNTLIDDEHYKRIKKGLKKVEFKEVSR